MAAGAAQDAGMRSRRRGEGSGRKTARPRLIPQ